MTRRGVELLASRQGRSISTAMGAVQLALVTAAAATTLEGGPVLALAIDGAVGQVASVVHGFCDWYNTGSYLVRRLNESGIVVDRTEVRRLTNAALMSKGQGRRPAGPRTRSTELRLVRSWVGRGLVDALPFGSTLGRASSRAAARIDESDLAALVRSIRGSRADPGDVIPGVEQPSGSAAPVESDHVEAGRVPRRMRPPPPWLPSGEMKR